MGIKPTILLYSHTDCKDVCKIFFGQTEKYCKNYNKIIFVNEDFDGIPEEYKKVFYDDKGSYKQRMVSCLEQISNQPILFIHEDMILFNNPKHEIIEEFTDLVMKKDAHFIKLIRAVEEISNTEIHNNLTTAPLHNMFSIQPTICMKNDLQSIFSESNVNSIYEFESIVSDICVKLGLNKCFMSHYDNENKRGAMHWDSKILPYIATAIVRGKWNYLEYSYELEALLKEYDVDKNERGLFLIF